MKTLLRGSQTRVKVGLAVAAAVLMPLAGLHTASADQLEVQNTTEALNAGQPSYFTVEVGNRNPEAVFAQLEAQGFDVLHGATRERLQVLAHAEDIAGLRNQGLTVKEDGPLYHPVDSSWLRTAAKNRAGDTYYGGYHTYDGHLNHNRQLASAHPDLVKVHDLGKTWTGKRTIQAVCITKISAGDCEQKQDSKKAKFVIMAQHHSRELSPGEVAWRWMDYLANGYGKDRDVTSMLDNYEMWVVPIANPDGLDIVSSSSGQPVSQRKNAHDNGCSGTGRGTDLNRNSPFKWDKNQGGTCSQTFPGTSPGSEPETQVLQNFTKALFPDTKGGVNEPASKNTRGALLTLHSAAQLVIFPYGFTNDEAPDHRSLQAMAQSLASGNRYQVVHGDGGLNYFAPGAIDDWAYGELGVPGFTIEIGKMTGAGNCSGFFPAYSCVDQYFNENLPGFKALTKHLNKPYN